MNPFSGKIPNPFTSKKRDDQDEKLDTQDRYGRERVMLVEHKHANRAQRRSMRGRSYVPRARNVSYVKEA
jgi:hypothetical protein